MELKEIPGTLGFMASEQGQIYDPQGVLRETYLNGDGYHTAALKDRGAKSVLAYNATTKQFKVFGSASQFIDMEQLSKKAVTVRLKKGFVSTLAGQPWWFTYLSEDADKKILDAIEMVKTSFQGPASTMFS